MLKKFNELNAENHLFQIGQPIYLVTREGTLLEDFTIQDIFLDLVSLNRPPFEGSDKQGFTIKGSSLHPNWCEGRKRIRGVYFDRKEAQDVVEAIRSKRSRASGE